MTMTVGRVRASETPRLVVTDSQAIDVVHEWTLGRTREGGIGGGNSSNGSGDDECNGDEADKNDSSTSSPQTRRHGVPLVDVTTFSIAMAARQSGGTEQLALMVEGISAARALKEVSFVLFLFCFFGD